MAKALVVYGSTTGNTETVAREIGRILVEKGMDVLVKDVTATRVEELGNGYNLTLLGSSTWGEAEIEFQEDFTSFYEEMSKARIKGEKVALFGCGDSSYEFFCGAVDLLEEKVGDLGGILVHESLRIDGDPMDAMADITAWTEAVVLRA